MYNYTLHFERWHESIKQIGCKTNVQVKRGGFSGNSRESGGDPNLNHPQCLRRGGGHVLSYGLVLIDHYRNLKKMGAQLKAKVMVMECVPTIQYLAPCYTHTSFIDSCVLDKIRPSNKTLTFRSQKSWSQCRKHMWMNIF